MEFSLNLAVIYTKWCAQTFLPIFRIFAIFDRNFAKIVAPPNNENENYVVHLKEQSLLKKNRWKPRRNRAINSNAMLVRTMHPWNEQHASLGAWQKKQNYKKKHTNTMFSHLQPARVVRSSPNFAWWQSSSRPSKKVLFIIRSNA